MSEQEDAYDLITDPYERLKIRYLRRGYGHYDAKTMPSRERAALLKLQAALGDGAIPPVSIGWVREVVKEGLR